MRTESFQWNNDKKGAAIEAFIHRTTIKNPVLMQEVLRLGLGDLTEWTDTNAVADATCGCLVGTCAIAAARLHLIDEQQVVDRRFRLATAGGEWPLPQLVPYSVAAAIARGNRAAALGIEEVGIFVADEAAGVDGPGHRDEDRELEVREYIEDLIATNLLLLGLSVPQRAAA